MSRTALLVLDMINEYIDSNGQLHCEKGKDIVDNILLLKDRIKKTGNLIVFVNTCFEPKDDTIITRKFGIHAIKGTWGSQTSSLLFPSENDLTVTKKTYDGFYNTKLDKVLRRNKIDTTVICGIHTHVCVLCTALSACYRDYRVIVISDAITTNNPVNHESRLHFFQSHVGELMTTNQYLAL